MAMPRMVAQAYRAIHRRSESGITESGTLASQIMGILGTMLLGVGTRERPLA